MPGAVVVENDLGQVPKWPVTISDFIPALRGHHLAVVDNLWGSSTGFERRHIFDFKNHFKMTMLLILKDLVFEIPNNNFDYHCKKDFHLIKKSL